MHHFSAKHAYRQAWVLLLLILITLIPVLQRLPLILGVVGGGGGVLLLLILITLIPVLQRLPLILGVVGGGGPTTVDSHHPNPCVTETTSHPGSGRGGGPTTVDSHHPNPCVTETTSHPGSGLGGGGGVLLLLILITLIPVLQRLPLILGVVGGGGPTTVDSHHPNPCVTETASHPGSGRGGGPTTVDSHHPNPCVTETASHPGSGRGGVLLLLILITLIPVLQRLPLILGVVGGGPTTVDSHHPNPCVTETASHPGSGRGGGSYYC